MSEETHQLQAIQPFVKSRINNNLIVCQSSFMRDADAGRLLLYPLCASQTHRLSVILLKSHKKFFDNSFFLFPLLFQSVQKLLNKLPTLHPANKKESRPPRTVSPTSIFKEGRGGRTPYSTLRDSTFCRPKGSPLCTNLRYPFLADAP